MRIAYIPFSKRRRDSGYEQRHILLYAKLKNLNIERYDDAKNYDVVVLPPTYDVTDLSIFKNERMKIVYQLVDDYLSEPKTSLKRNFRGPLRWILGESKHLFFDYTNCQKNLCQKAHAVICSSDTQLSNIEKINPNVHMLFEGNFHNSQTFKTDFNIGSTVRLVWEGMAENLYSFEAVTEMFDTLSEKLKIELHIITDLSYRSLLGLFLEKPTSKKLKSLFKERFSENTIIRESRVFLHQWNKGLVSPLIQSCDLAILPINKKKNFIQAGKSNNKLIIMLRNGIPTLCSKIQSFETISKEAGMDICCDTTSEWVEKALELIQSSELRKTLSEKGLSYVENKYSQQKFIDQWDHVFESVK